MYSPEVRCDCDDRLQVDLRELFSDMGPYIVHGSGKSPCSFPWSPYRTPGTTRRWLFPTPSAAAGVDVLSHQKKAAFWRELVALFPNIIDYLCNPNVNPVRHKIDRNRST